MSDHLPIDGLGTCLPLKVRLFGALAVPAGDFGSSCLRWSVRRFCLLVMTLLPVPALSQPWPLGCFLGMLGVSALISLGECSQMGLTVACGTFPGCFVLWEDQGFRGVGFL